MSYVVVTLLLAIIVGFDWPWALLADLLIALVLPCCCEETASAYALLLATVRVTRQESARLRVLPAEQISIPFSEIDFQNSAKAFAVVVGIVECNARGLQRQKSRMICGWSAG